MAGQSGKKTKYTIPAGAGFVSILCTTLCRQATIVEDDAATRTGLKYSLPNDNFTAVFNVAATSEPITLGDPIPYGRATGQVLGNGPDSSGGYSIPATPLINISSLGGAGTTVVVTEYN